MAKGRPAGIAKSVSLTMIVIAALVFAVSGCVTKAPDAGPYLVLYAFQEEGQSISERMAVTGTARHLGRKVTRGRLSGKEIVLAELGIGMTNAAMTTQRMIDLYQPRAVVVTGIAGAIDTAVNIGDITVCQTWITHDYGYVGSDGFQAGRVSVALPDYDSLVKVADFAVDSAMFAVVDGFDSGTVVFDKIGERMPKLLTGGVGVSGNTFIDQKEKRLWLSEMFGAMVTDMESAAVAQVCAANGVPFIVFRSASDLAGGSGSETARDELDRFFEIAADNSSKVVLRFLQEL